MKLSIGFISTLKALVMATCIAMISVSLNADENMELPFVVVMNPDGEEHNFSKAQLRQIFMGGGLSRKYKAINLPAGHPLRKEFNTRVIGLTEARIQSFWAQMRFTGRSEAPEEASSVQQTLVILEKSPNTIAYLPADAMLPDNLVIIYP